MNSKLKFIKLSSFILSIFSIHFQNFDAKVLRKCLIYTYSYITYFKMNLTQLKQITWLILQNLILRKSSFFVVK